MEEGTQRVLVTGAGGMLATDLMPRLRHAGYSVIPARRSGQSDQVALDITDERAVRDVLNQHRPDVVVNCAAFTAVDDAERSYDSAFMMNAVGPANLARGAREIGALLVHISSDYVFGGAQARPRVPFREEDVMMPCGLYGQSKRFGDELVLSLAPGQSLILRTSWLHGAHGPNFVATILRLARENSSIKVVADQYGSPTWTGWLADTIIRLVALGGRGVFHASSRGDITWLDFANEIVRQTRGPLEVVPQTTAELARPAPRPAYSTLDCSKLEGALQEPCIDWKEGLRRHLESVRHP